MLKFTSIAEGICKTSVLLVSGTVFHALSHGVTHFVWSVSSKHENLKMEVFDWLLKNFNQRESGFSS